MDAITLDQKPSAASDQTFSNRQKRKRLFLLFGGALILVAACWWVWSTFIAADTESTENAYANVEVAQVTPLVGGPVKRVLVVNSQLVHAGDVLVALDDTDLRLAVEQAEAALGHAQRQVRQVQENDASLAGREGVRDADEATARADLVRAQADLDKAQLDERRRQTLAGPGRGQSRSRNIATPRPPCARPRRRLRRQGRGSPLRKPRGLPRGELVGPIGR